MADHAPPSEQPGTVAASVQGRIEALCDQAFGPDAATITALTDVNRGRGVFSVVLRASLAWSEPTTDPTTPRPDAVVAKLPVDGPNGAAAIASGAYDREALAYRRLLPHAAVRAPHAYTVVSEDGATSLLLEDLSGHRAVDQLDGLSTGDATTVAEALARFHRPWTDPERLAGLAVRHNTIASLDPAMLDRGLQALATTWSDELDNERRTGFAALVERRAELIERFEDAGPSTLCHGDPRADNLVFDAAGHVVLFDWQQLAVQFGEADLAWLAATSLTTDERRRADRSLVDAYGGALDRYRLGMALPGLTVLALAQRELTSERARRFVAESLRRIGAALLDLDVTRP